jgi:hypothetical protein
MGKSQAAEHQQPFNSSDHTKFWKPWKNVPLITEEPFVLVD